MKKIMRMFLSIMIVATMLFSSLFPIAYAVSENKIENNTVSQKSGTTNAVKENTTKQSNDVTNNTVANNTVTNNTTQTNTTTNNTVEGKKTETKENTTKVEEKETSKGVTNTVSGIQGKARMWVDNPVEGYNLEEGVLLINGWRMATVTGTKLNFYIDGKKVEVEVKNEDRQDVLNLVKGYGDKTINPQPGFRARINVMGYSVGKHTLKVEVVNKEGQVLTNQSINFNLKKIEEKARMCIDTPTTQTIVTNGKLSIVGWSMARVPDTTLKFYIDGKVVTASSKKVGRQDVLDLVRGYGTVATNPQPGFNATIDVSSYGNGTHNLKVEVITKEGKAITGQSTNFKIEKPGPKARMWVDNPVEGYNLEEGVLLINGWRMATVTGTKLNFYIDGKKVEVETQNENRQDVLNLVKGYGDKTINPQPGFRARINIMGYSVGKHTLKVEVVTKDNQVLTDQIINFNLKKIEEKSRMCIDAPTAQTTVTNGKLSIVGWSMARVPDTTLKFYIDGKVVTASSKKVGRQDVLDLVKGYGTVATNPQPGFNATIDVSSYGNGTHTLKVEVITKEGKAITGQSTNFKIEKPGPKARMCIDTPTSSTVVQEGKLKVVGWTMATEANSQLKVYIDGNLVNTNLTRVVRQDVLNLVKGYGSKNENPKPGFEANLDVSSYSQGTHTLKIEVYTKSGTKINDVSTTFKIDKTPGLKYQGYVWAYGWNGYAKNGNTAGATGKDLEGIQISFLGSLPANAHIQYQVYIRGIGWQAWKQDGQVAGITAQNRRIEGVRVKLQNADNYSVTYRTYVQGKGWQEWAIDGELSGILGKGVQAIQVKLTNKIAEKARLEIDSPSLTSGNLYVPKGKLEIVGWALANSKDAQIKAYIDGKEQALQITRNYRQDVVDLVKGYGGAEWTPNPGFTTYVDFSSYTSGSKHKLEVKVVSKVTGKVLASKTQQVIISKETNGIDVSYHNGMINWNEVKKSQDFVMIRAGFRGYGGGTINMDQNFLRNVQGAQSAGLKIGLYFFTQAINEAEAREEANWIVDMAQKYRITYPIVIDTEYSGSTTNGVPDYEGRADNLDKATRTKVVKAFLDTVKARGGYTPAIYASKNWLNENLDMSKLAGYDVWLAQYNDTPTYNGAYTMWQYTSKGSVSGITGNVDMNKCYKNY